MMRLINNTKRSLKTKIIGGINMRYEAGDRVEGVNGRELTIVQVDSVNEVYKMSNGQLYSEEHIKSKVFHSEDIETIDYPKHYNQGKYEVIDIIEDWGLGFNLGNAIKYIARCKHKGNKVQDIQKAIWYLQREITSKEEQHDQI